jgi:hypothetical protein
LRHSPSGWAAKSGELLIRQDRKSLAPQESSEDSIPRPDTSVPVSLPTTAGRRTSLQDRRRGAGTQTPSLLCTGHELSRDVPAPVDPLDPSPSVEDSQALSTTELGRRAGSAESAEFFGADRHHATSTRPVGCNCSPDGTVGLAAPVIATGTTEKTGRDDKNFGHPTIMPCSNVPCPRPEE